MHEPVPVLYWTEKQERSIARQIDNVYLYKDGRWEGHLSTQFGAPASTHTGPVVASAAENRSEIRRILEDWKSSPGAGVLHIIPDGLDWKAGTPGILPKTVTLTSTAWEARHLGPGRYELVSEAEGTALVDEEGLAKQVLDILDNYRTPVPEVDISF